MIIAKSDADVRYRMRVDDKKRIKEGLEQTRQEFLRQGILLEVIEEVVRAQGAINTYLLSERYEDPNQRIHDHGVVEFCPQLLHYAALEIIKRKCEEAGFSIMISYRWITLFDKEEVPPDADDMGILVERPS